MTTWTLADTIPTADPRVRVGQWGTGNWRTVVQDAPGEDWTETGPPYPTRKAALAAVPDVLAYYFGDEPTRAQLAERIKIALEVAQYSYERAHRVDQPGIQRVIKALQGHFDQPRERPPAVLAGHGPWPWERAGLRDEDLEVSTVRPGATPYGQGGQTTGDFDPYVRITHLPTGITVDCDTERSQLMNKDRALHELARLLRERVS